MSENKTKPTDESPYDFINTIENETKRNDSLKLIEIMKEVTGHEPVMWGESIIGFDEYHYKYDSGREGDFLKVGFSPRKAALTLYIMSGFKPYEEKLKKLGKHKTGGSCLYVKKLDDIDLDILKEMIIHSVNYISDRYK